MAISADSSLNPTRDDFAALLDASYGENEAFEGSVVKGTVVGIEKDVLVIDIGLKTEGRVAIKEFTGYGRDPAPQIGEEVEVYLERVENALGEAVLSRDKANAVKLSFSAGRMTLFSSNPDYGEASEELPAQYDGEALQTGFNARYLMDILSATDSDEVQLELSDDRSPGVVRPVEDDGYLGVVMPIRL